MSNPDTINPNLNYQSDVTPSTPFIVKDVALKAFLFSLYISILLLIHLIICYNI